MAHWTGAEEWHVEGESSFDHVQLLFAIAGCHFVDLAGPVDLEGWGTDMLRQVDRTECTWDVRDRT